MFNYGLSIAAHPYMTGSRPKKIMILREISNLKINGYNVYWHKF